MADEVLAAALERLLGDRDYRVFVRALERDRPELLFWQSKVLDALVEQTGLSAPRCPATLRGLLPPLPTPPGLDEVPPWIVVEKLEGTAPVQGWGTMNEWRWYFRARHESWQLSATRDAVDPVEVEDNSTDHFYVSEPYGYQPSDASYMSMSEARHFIVRELNRLRSRQ
jgi:hypothetical protein